MAGRDVWSRNALRPGVRAAVLHAHNIALHASQQFVDVLDTEKRWCLAEVLDANDTVSQLHFSVSVADVRVQHVTIHYHGWPEKFREVLQKKDPRIQEPLTKTGAQSFGVLCHVPPCCSM